MLNITHASASAAILRAVDKGTLVQGAWHKKHEGREVACLLGSMDPGVKSAKDCNGDLMPVWMAEVTITLFDRLPEDQILPISRRYGSLVARWHVLKPAQWQSVLTRFLIRTIDDALEYARPLNVGKPYWDTVEKVCAQCRAAVESGDKDAAANAADAAATYAAAAAAAAYATFAHAAQYAARAAASAARAARAARAAHYAANAAANAADAAAAYAAAAYAVNAANAAALFSFLLDQIEVEIVAAESTTARASSEAPGNRHDR